MRRALTISLITMAPAWCLRVILVHQFLIQADHRTLMSFLPFSGEWAFLALDVTLGAVVVLALFRSGRGRSEFWWLAGGLFVVAAATTSLIFETPEAGDFVFVDFVFSMLSGYWLAVFVVGALAWRHWTPTYPPRSWTRPPSADYEDR